MYVDTNNSVRSWQILYANHILQYVNGNAAMVMACFGEVRGSNEKQTKHLMFKEVGYESHG